MAVTAGIEKRLFMVSVEESDCDALRFLWMHNVQENLPRIQPLRFTRVVFGVSSSPFLLNALSGTTWNVTGSLTQTLFS